MKLIRSPSPKMTSDEGELVGGATDLLPSSSEWGGGGDIAGESVTVRRGTDTTDGGFVSLPWIPSSPFTDKTHRSSANMKKVLPSMMNICICPTGIHPAVDLNNSSRTDAIQFGELRLENRRVVCVIRVDYDLQQTLKQFVKASFTGIGMPLLNVSGMRSHVIATGST